MKLESKDLVLLETRKYRNKTYGVTYTSAQLCHNGEIVAVRPYEGSTHEACCEHWAARELEAMFGLEPGQGSLWRLKADLGVWVVCVHRKGTKRETIAFGKGSK